MWLIIYSDDVAEDWDVLECWDSENAANKRLAILQKTPRKDWLDDFINPSCYAVCFLELNTPCCPLEAMVTPLAGVE